MIGTHHNAFERWFFDDPKGIYIDFSGDISSLTAHCPDSTILLDMSDREFPVSFNPMSDTESVVNAFYNTFSHTWGAQLEENLSYAVASLKDKGTLLWINHLFLNKTFRNRVLKSVKDSVLKSFWFHFDGLPKKDQLQLTSSVRNKISPLLLDSRIRNILGQLHTSFPVDQKMIVSIPLREFGRVKTKLLASLFITYVMSESVDNPIYVKDADLIGDLAQDLLDAQNVVHLTYQKNSRVKIDLASVDNVIVTKVSQSDGVDLEKELSTFRPLHLQHPNEAHVRTPEFEKLVVLPSIEGEGRKNEIRATSRRRYAQMKKDVEHKVTSFLRSK